MSMYQFVIIKSIRAIFTLEKKSYQDKNPPQPEGHGNQIQENKGTRPSEEMAMKVL